MNSIRVRACLSFSSYFVPLFVVKWKKEKNVVIAFNRLVFPVVYLVRLVVYMPLTSTFSQWQWLQIVYRKKHLLTNTRGRGRDRERECERDGGNKRSERTAQRQPKRSLKRSCTRCFNVGYGFSVIAYTFFFYIGVVASSLALTYLHTTPLKMCRCLYMEMRA